MRKVFICTMAMVAIFLGAAPGHATPVGEIFDHNTFSPEGNPSLDSRYKSDGFVDFSSNEYTQWIPSNGDQILKIKEEANNNGDNGMFKDFSASANQTYKAQAWVWEHSWGWPFGTRVVIHFWNSSSHGTFLGECGTRHVADLFQNGYDEVSVSCSKTDSRIGDVDISVKANNGCSGCANNGDGYGRTDITRIRFSRTS